MEGAMIALAGMIITLVLNFILIPRIGYMGAAWATFFCYASMMMLSYFAGRRYYPVPYDILRISAYILLAVLLYYLASVFEAGNRIADAIYNLLLLMAYIILVLLTEKFLRPQRLF